MPGWGSQPFGVAPYGVGTPAQAPVTGGSPLRDPATGVSTGSRRIDPRTGDYVVDANGRTLGMNDTQQLVLMATSTVRRSSAMPNLGIRIGEIQTMGDGFDREVRAILEEALADLVATGRIEILGVDVQRLHPGAARPVLRWRDRATEREHSLEI